MPSPLAPDQRQTERLLTQRARQSTAIADLGLRALEGMDLQSLMDRAVQAVVETLEVEMCKVLELLPEGDKLLLCAGVGWHAGLLGQATVSAGIESQAGYTLQSQHPVVVSDLCSEDRFHGPSLLFEHEVVSGLSVVIFGKDRPFGVLCAHTTRQRLFTEDDIHFLQAVAHVLATAIQRRQSDAKLQAQSATLQASEVRLRAIFDSGPECVKLLAADGTLLEMNAAGLSMIEADSAEQALGRCIYPLVAPKHRADFQMLVERVFRGESGILEFEIVGLKGTRRRLETHASPLRGSNGRIISQLSITRDVGPRRRAEEGLRLAYAQLTATMDALPDWMFEVDTTGRIFDFRASPLDRPSVQPAKFLGKRLCEVLPAEAAQIIGDAIQKADSLGMYWGGTYSLDLPRGKCWFELSIARKGQSLGADSRFVLLARDITDRIRIEQELRASRASLEEAQAIASLGSWQFDTDRLVGTWSKEMFRLFDRDPSEKAPSFEEYLETIHPEDRHLLPEANARAIQNDEKPEIVYRTNPALGPMRYLSGRVQADRDAHGRVFQLAGTLRDVTKLKLADDALRESEKRFRVLIDQAADSMFVHDFDGKLLDVNRSACESLGYSRDELLTLSVADLETGVPDKALREKWESLQSGTPFTVNGRHRRKDGTEFPVEVRVGLIEAGGVHLILGLVRDVTERKHAEAERQRLYTELRIALERTQSLSREVLTAQETERSQIARELHDEIGQVLTAVSLKLHHLKSCCGEESQRELDAGLSLIDSAINEVRDMSLNLRPPMLDVLGLEPTIRWCVDQHRELAGWQVQLDLRLESRLSPNLEITCFRVVQAALTNIARHAKASQVDIEIRHSEAELELVVSDNGVGFNSGEIQQRSEQGGSFGLSAMRQRVELAGGTFRIDSSPGFGRGTTIRAYFPLLAATPG
ncbi:MAG: PAS/PAC and Chase sensor-containing diguanylate cyclase/phosphodiesterase [Planctomycetota bacterium]|nr:MAG: PAS/PAC and Chase sensor-containing diguanylate cyclase/phosphodiesterase [Planctomycetota bacterium]